MGAQKRVDPSWTSYQGQLRAVVSNCSNKARDQVRLRIRVVLEGVEKVFLLVGRLVAEQIFEDVMFFQLF